MSDSSSCSDEESVGQPEVMSDRLRQIVSSGVDYHSYATDANFVIYFKLVHSKEEALEDIKKNTFYPDFVHQFFVDNERVFGYKKPVIRLFYSASRLKRYVKFDYEEKLDRERHGIEADNVYKLLSPLLENTEYTEDFNNFIKEVDCDEERHFLPPGDLIQEIQCDYRQPELLSRAQLEMALEDIRQKDLEEIRLREASNTNGESSNGFQNGKTKHVPSKNNTASSSSSHDATNDHDEIEKPPQKKRFCFYHANNQNRAFEKFQDRMQTLIMWFIESATMIDFEDPKWDFFVVFEKYNPSVEEDPQAVPLTTEDRYYFAGYATVYKYFAYPDKIRPRVSQMLLLPPYRRNGLGTKLLQNIYDYYAKLPGTLDITAEDPDEEFIKMRDFLDCKNCMKLPAFQPDNLKSGWTDDIAKEAREKLKLCPRQARKVYEILKLKSLDQTNEEELSQYRLEVKNRLNIPRRRFKLDCERAEKRGMVLSDDIKQKKESVEFAVVSLDENYRELASQYQHTIDKLNRSCVR